jgi:hypothetical protein
MNILRVNFQELYERHLCRHSQFGINVLHLTSVVGVYLALFGLLYHATQSEWVLAVLGVIYLGILAFNLPAGVFAATALFLGLLFAGAIYLPELPWWAYVVIVLVFHRLQVWHHYLYTEARDMTEFNKKYKKGLALFVLLSVYELPILLKYLCFDPRNWSAAPAPEVVETVGSGGKS